MLGDHVRVIMHHEDTQPRLAVGAVGLVVGSEVIVTRSEQGPKLRFYWLVDTVERLGWHLAQRSWTASVQAAV